MNRKIARSRQEIEIPVKAKNRCVVDWFEFTFKVDYRFLDVYDNSLKHFFKCFPEFRRDLDHMGVEREKGSLNYNRVFDVAGAYTIYYSTTRYDMGVHVRFPGSAVPLLAGLFNIKCDEFGMSVFKDLLKVFLSRLERVSGAYIKWSRIDLAFDDFTKKYSPADYIVFQFTNRLRTKCKFAQMNFSKLQTPNQGSTFYLGSRGGNNHNVRFLRIYDKEYQSKGLIKSIRYELELRGGYATSVVSQILSDDDGKVDFGYLIQQMFVVIDPISYKGYSAGSLRVAKHRASVNTEWLTIFGTQVSRIVVKIPGRVPIDTLDRLVNYLTNMRRPLRYYLDSCGVQALCSLIQSYQYTDHDKRVLHRLQYEALNLIPMEVMS